MSSLNYIPLRATSQYSLLEGAMQIENIVKKAINHKIPAVGLTDRNNLFGALEFSEKLIEKGNFRSDLFFRLNVLPLVLPALRDRKEDLPSLIQFMLKKFNAKQLFY